MNRMKNKRQGHKVLSSSCYRRKLSRTLSNSSISQLVQLGSYKKRINDLSRNNRILATALQESRLESAVQSSILNDYAKDSNNILFARLKLNEMAKNIAKLATDLEEARSYLDVKVFKEAPKCFGNNKRSSDDKIYKIPGVDCIEEVTEESTNSEIITRENFSVIENCPGGQSDDKQSHVLPGNSANNEAYLGEVNVIAPILFAEDTSDTKKKSSNKGKSSKHDSDAGSLTPVLNINLSSVKLKRNSSRRQTQFLFPGSRSTSRGKNTPGEKENSPEELVTPTIPALPPIINRIQNTTETKTVNHETFQNFDNNNINKKESKNCNILLENHTKLAPDTNPQGLSQVSIMDPSKNLKTVVAPQIPFSESNRTVLLCEDMELTDIIRCVPPIVSSPCAAKSNLDASNINHNKDTKKNDAVDVTVKTKENDINNKIVPERYSVEMHTDQNDVQLPEINEDDEVQNVAQIIFCDNNTEDNASRITKSSLIRPSRSKKPVKFVFFSSDESEEDSPFKFSEKMENSKRKTVINTEIIKPCENIVSQCKASTEKENNVAKSHISKYNVDTLYSDKEKTQKKKSLKRSKTNKKSDSLKKPFEKCSASPKDVLNKNTFSPITPDNKLKKTQITSKDENFMLNKNENNKTSIFSPFTPPSSILKKTQPLYSAEEKENEMPMNKMCNNNLENSFENIIASPKSESRKVSFAGTDIVCSFKRMSTSKRIAENKKISCTSKSVYDLKELLDDKAKTKTHTDADDSSKSSNNQKLDDPVALNFSDDTELYFFKPPSNINPSSPTTDDLIFHKSPTVSEKKNVKKSNKSSKKAPPASKHVSTHKLSLKKSKDSKSTVPQHISSEMIKEINISMIESPVSVGKHVERKSLFKDDLDGDSKENHSFDHQVLEKPKTVLKEKQVKKNSEISDQIDCAKKLASSNCQKKASMKKLSDKPKLFQPTPETKKKKKTTEMRSLENTPVLRDTINLPENENCTMASKRRSRNVCYKEPSLNKKLRRE